MPLAIDFFFFSSLQSHSHYFPPETRDSESHSPFLALFFNNNNHSVFTHSWDDLIFVSRRNFIFIIKEVRMYITIHHFHSSIRPALYNIQHTPFVLLWNTHPARRCLVHIMLLCICLDCDARLFDRSWPYCLGL